MVNRRTAFVVLGGVAGTALLGGSLKFAIPASADAHRHHPPSHRHTARPPVRPTMSPTVTPAPTMTASPTAGPTVSPTAGPTTSPTAGPTAIPTLTPTASPACATASGNATTVASPGVGTVTVTITICDGTITAATSTQTQSNWEDNELALPAMDQLTLTYAQTDINMVNYSGATLTSQAYRTSLTSALSKAGI